MVMVSGNCMAGFMFQAPINLVELFICLRHLLMHTGTAGQLHLIMHRANGLYQTVSCNRLLVVLD